MTHYEAGRLDSVRFIALNMAIPAFDMLDSLDTDQRYHLARIFEVSGVLDVANAHADTILRGNSSHLLALALSASLARESGDTARARTFDKRLLAAEKSELERGLSEYRDHRIDIDSALARARRGGK
jgi:hypothetical protein